MGTILLRLLTTRLARIVPSFLIRPVIVQGNEGLHLRTCSNKLDKSSKLENKSSIYFQQPSCSLAEKEQADLKEKGIPEELPINRYNGKHFDKEQLK